MVSGIKGRGSGKRRLACSSHRGRGGRGERPGWPWLAVTVCAHRPGYSMPAGGRDESRPRSLTAGLRFHSCLPLVRKAG